MSYRPRETTWVVVFRQSPTSPWRLYTERHSHHGASEEKAEGKLKHPAWEFSLVRKTVEWEWDG